VQRPPVERAPVDRPAADQRTVPQAQQQPGQQQAASGYAQPAPAQPAAQVPTVDTARIEALNAQRETLMMLGTRANACKASLYTIKQQQARMGTNLRGDIAAAEQRMEFLLSDAENAAKAGDPDRMKKNLDSAERVIDTIEKFLGR